MRDLLALTAELVDIPSVSRSEQQIADRVEEELSGVPWLSVERVGDTVVARTDLGRPHRVVVAGHLDTVPPGANFPSVTEGNTCSGVGAVDMKGGIAVMLALAVAGEPTELDLSMVFYACEEIDRADNALRILSRQRPDLLACDTAILCEPTAGGIEAGCQGTLRAEVVVSGTRAHTARPWMGRNAIHRLGRVIALVEAYEGRKPTIEGCEYRESLQAVWVEGGVAGNVVPDQARLVVNHRFAPDRSVDEASALLVELLSPAVDFGGGDRFTLVDAVGGALPRLNHPVCRRLAEIVAEPPKAKLGWTDVALFAEMGIPALNFGPGDSSLAHSPNEKVSARELDHAYRVLACLAGIPSGLPVPGQNLIGLPSE